MKFFSNVGSYLKGIVNLSGHIDTAAAEQSIRSNIYFRGPNAWILCFSILIASIGLNINSIPVIIGAMLISPLMGPIFGIGMALGINDIDLLKEAGKNLLTMMLISLLASCIYFLITPLNLSNPTELLARTNPTIYDVLIALFGGSAGIFEQCRKEKGTVFSGVAIATALMPPMCTAGYGLANGNMHYLFGALYLFFINCVFIALATYVATKLLHFRAKDFSDAKAEKKTKWLLTIFMLIFIVPSIWSAVTMIQNNNFQDKANGFVKENRNLGNSIIYDYSISHEDGGRLEIFISGEELTASQRSKLYENALSAGLKNGQLIINEHTNGQGKVERELIQGIYSRTDSEINRRDTEIKRLESELELIRRTEIPYTQVAREAVNSWPEIEKISIGDGASVRTDSLNVAKGLTVIVHTNAAMGDVEKEKFHKWLTIRLNNENIELVEVAPATDPTTKKRKR
ncbi:MAG: DUF389 domain-containing protein [Candidatus Cryptobacteroides sp.]